MTDLRFTAAKVLLFGEIKGFMELNGVKGELKDDSLQYLSIQISLTMTEKPVHPQHRILQGSVLLALP